MDTRAQYKEIIMEKLDLEVLSQDNRFDTDRVNEMVEIMLEVICSIRPTICINGKVLEKTLNKFLEEIEKAQKPASQPKTYLGKKSIKHLMEQNSAIKNIEVTDGNIKSLERTASKYGIGYALKKDTSEQPL